MIIDDVREAVSKGKYRKQELQLALDKAQTLLIDSSFLLNSRELAQALIQQTAKETQDQIKFNLQDLVQSAMDAVFPAVYSFRLDFALKRGRTECEITLNKDGEVMNPMDSNGGGIVDLIAFALRVSVWAIGRSRNTLILDEPFKWLSAGYRPLAIEILKSLSTRLKLQVIMVTHDQEIIAIADRIFTVDQRRRKAFLKVTEGEPCSNHPHA